MIQNNYEKKIKYQHTKLRGSFNKSFILASDYNDGSNVIWKRGRNLEVLIGKDGRLV